MSRICKVNKKIKLPVNKWTEYEQFSYENIKMANKFQKVFNIPRCQRNLH